MGVVHCKPQSNGKGITSLTMQLTRDSNGGVHESQQETVPQSGFITFACSPLQERRSTGFTSNVGTVVPAHVSLHVSILSTAHWISSVEAV